MNLLEVERMSAFYGSVAALRDIDLHLAAGEIVVVLGANGAGKTTLMRAVSRMVRTSGRISLGGQDIQQLGTEATAKRGIAHVPSGRGTFAQLTVEENLRLGTMSRVRRRRREIEADLRESLELFPVLGDKLNAKAGTLSGGQQQILAIARGLLGRPRLLMVDELSLGLAPAITAEIFETLLRLRRDTGLAILLAEQNIHFALEVADRGYMLTTGTVDLEGTVDQLAGAARTAYLGSTPGPS